MELREQQRKGWLYTCTPAERIALFGTMGAWAREIGDRTDLDPLESRAMYRVFARELADLAQREQGAARESDRNLRRQWGRLRPPAQATWIRAAGGWFDWESPGRDAAEVISSSLSPPRFMTLAGPQRQDLLSQIAGEVREYLRRDPQWYGTHTEAYRVLAGAVHGLQRPDEEPAHWRALRWSHVDAPQRSGVLRDIATMAQRGSYGKALQPEVRGHLQDLARSADWIADLHRPRVLIRG